ncbi:hypothetical protein ACQY0O_007878 [Thecaphora frezii]
MDKDRERERLHGYDGDRDLDPRSARDAERNVGLISDTERRSESKSRSSTAIAAPSGSRSKLAPGLEAANAKGASSSLAPPTESKCSCSPSLPAHFSSQEGLPSCPWLPPAIQRELTMHDKVRSATGQHLAMLSAASTPRPAKPRLTTELETLATARRTFLADFYVTKRSLIRAACI